MAIGVNKVIPELQILQTEEIIQFDLFTDPEQLLKERAAEEAALERAINTTFLDAGLLNAVNVLIGAGIDGRASHPPVFHSEDEERKLTRLELLDAKPYASGAVLIWYKVPASE